MRRQSWTTRLLASLWVPQGHRRPGPPQERPRGRKARGYEGSSKATPGRHATHRESEAGGRAPLARSRSVREADAVPTPPSYARLGSSDSTGNLARPAALGPQHRCGPTPRSKVTVPGAGSPAPSPSLTQCALRPYAQCLLGSIVFCGFPLWKATPFPISRATSKYHRAR